MVNKVKGKRMSQEIRNILLKDLVLWSENPRDPITSDASNEDIVARAISNSEKWELQKLANNMGDFYDFSELPTIVYKKGKPIVYDGNRRVILGLLSHHLVNIEHNIKNIPSYNITIPCNVCSEDIALQSIWRKHAESGSWDPLERDIFQHNHLKKDKSNFIIIDEATGLISNNKELNKVFVKEEIFSNENLKKLGFSIQRGKLCSQHSELEGQRILDNLAEQVKNKNISTRKNRGKVYEILKPENQKVIDANWTNPSKEYTSTNPITPVVKRQSARSKKKATPIFGGKLYLNSGDVSDLYRDITELYDFYDKHKNKLGPSFPVIIRMALRLLVESAADDKGIKDYIDQHFENAKLNLSQDEKTTLFSHNVSEKTLTQLLHIGAHKYGASKNLEQSLAMSLLIGKILEQSHGQKK